MINSLVSLVSIDGNIKQQFLPFLLSPDGLSMPQVFSFKANKNKNFGKLHICPNSIEQNLTKDLSFQSIYAQNNNPMFDINSLYDSIPGLQIREFLPDTKLDQALNFFGGIFTAIQDAFTPNKESTSENNKKFQEVDVNSKPFIEKMQKVVIHAAKMLTYMEPQFYDALKNGGFYAEARKRTRTFSGSGSVKESVLDFPYTLWYCLQSSTTTNIYEVPGITSDKELYRSNGHAGWDGAAGFSLVGDDSLVGNIGGKLGKIANTLFGNINISFMPWWDAKKGNATPFTDVKIKFDLFNDTAEAAAMNFIFVNTLVPNAKWIQYNLFQHSSNIYDIKLDGYKRLYACSGDFTVTYSGILRDIRESWFNANLKKHINSCMNSSEFSNYILKHKLIKIPDVYHVEMNFKSLLPDTFNNYLYMYSSSNIVTDDTYPVRRNSAALNAIQSGIKTFADELKKKWNE